MKVISYIVFISLTVLSLSGAGDSIARCAIRAMGKPYKSGEAGPIAFDEFGLVYYCHKVVNDIQCYRDKGNQAIQGKKVTKPEPGDVIYGYDKLNRIVEALIYIGDNQVVYVSPNLGVTKTTIYKLNYMNNRYDYRRLW